MKVIYIIGCGRSGTTLTNLILGNHPNLTSIGEIYNIHARGWQIGGEAECACGQLVSKCPYWEDVRKLWIASVGEDGIERYIQYQKRWEEYKPLAKFKLFWTIRQRISPSAEFAEYVRMTVALYDAIGRVSGKPHIVDSSKNPLRAYALLLGRHFCPELDLYMLHVVRDGRGVIWSKLKSRKRKAYRGVTVPRYFFSRTSLYWAFKNLLCEGLAKMVGDSRSLQLNYEQIVEEPEVALFHLGALISEDFSDLGNALANNHPIHSGHIVDGNRLRMTDTITVKADQKWKTQFPDKERELFWKLAGWTARRYGYQARLEV